MIWGQVAGLAFAADVVAAFAGILAKRSDRDSATINSIWHCC